jgi:hypothetical protein
MFKNIKSPISMNRLTIYYIILLYQLPTSHQMTGEMKRMKETDHQNKHIILTRDAAKELSVSSSQSLGFTRSNAKLAGYFRLNIGPNSRHTNWPFPQSVLISLDAAPKLEVKSEYWERPCPNFPNCRSESSALPPVIGNGFRCDSSNYKFQDPN